MDTCYIMMALKDIITSSEINYPAYLGEGEFGQVFKAEIRKLGAVAIRKLNLEYAELLPTFAGLIDYNHINIVKPIALLKIDRQWCVLTQFIDNENLRKKLEDKTKPLSFDIRIKILMGIASGLAYLHDAFCKNKMHLLLNSNNVLLNQALEPKLSDYGLLKPIDLQEIYYSPTPTERQKYLKGYMPPDLDSGIASGKFDSYSYGIIVLEIVSGLSSYKPDISGPSADKPVYLGDHFLQCCGNPEMLFYCDEDIEWPSNEYVFSSEEMQEIAYECLKKDRLERPTMSECYRTLLEIKNFLADPPN
ncbi:uncharacterized protein TRIADDRAFT_56776 [Trichoplax adhaerens]|uniref:Protein kinase domain-containing protein n=1 Tax=Trichoplax adhaerens TaxID=10228 RepID=B3RWJ9_TRIAD|nr:hypothetical protein TRIADDRAFT_56776 [Trichoplax adhaerens]EDV24705.1 hypothetical protein TRIADDRAFT_56776 [Trichoplax adhaerens]|eukprot:XP_002112595.1 hypothetical protein TRIADDRAFT_56776 [Trichoplax adhaerens]